MPVPVVLSPLVNAGTAAGPVLDMHRPERDSAALPDDALLSNENPSKVSLPPSLTSDDASTAVAQSAETTDSDR